MLVSEELGLDGKTIVFLLGVGDMEEGVDLDLETIVSLVLEDKFPRPICDEPFIWRDVDVSEWLSPDYRRYFSWCRDEYVTCNYDFDKATALWRLRYADVCGKAKPETLLQIMDKQKKK